MTITMTGTAKYAPSWDALQTLLRSMVNDNEAVLTRIARRDGGVSYRDSGVYDLTLRTEGREVPVELHVTLERDMGRYDDMAPAYVPAHPDGGELSLRARLGRKEA